MFGHFSGDSSAVQAQLKGAQHVPTESRCEAQVVCLCVCGNHIRSSRSEFAFSTVTSESQPVQTFQHR